MRSSALDVLRAVAVILVFSAHSGILPILSHIGWMGVDLFFVLSGFLVSGLLFREYRESQQVRAGRFLARRGFKIYPQFYALTAVTITVAAWRGIPVSWRVIAADVTFLQSYLPGFWGHTWSLAVEEHFYLLLAVVIGLLAKRGGENPFRALPKWIFAIFAAVLFARVATWWLDPPVLEQAHIYRSFYWTPSFPKWSYAAHLLSSHLRMDSLLAGVLLSYYHVFHGEALLQFVNRFRGWLAPISILTLTPALFLEQVDPLLYTAGFSAIWLGFALLLLLVVYPVRPPASPGRVERALAGIGRVS
jgi:peptidoglycan/LPS O-acetylase OafA/YrhL